MLYMLDPPFYIILQIGRLGMKSDLFDSSFCSYIEGEAVKADKPNYTALTDCLAYNKICQWCIYGEIEFV